MAIPLIVAAGIAAAGSAASQHSGASSANDNISSANSQLGGIRAGLQGQGDQLNQMATDAYSPLTQNFGSDMNAYRDLANQPSKQFGYEEFSPFDYNIDSGIQKFMDPMIEAKIKAATDNIQASAANTGGLFSSATGHGMATEAATLKGDSWKDALQAAMQDRNFEAGRFESDRDRADRGVEFEADQYNTNLGRQSDVLGNLTRMGSDATMNLADSKINTQRDVFSGMNDIDMQRIANDMQRQDDSLLGALGAGLTGGGSAFSSFMGAKKGAE